jgi:NACHT domain
MSEVNRQMCLEKTRLDIIKFIMDWIADESSDQKRILWLYGLAGSGKSTLATTIAWMMRDLDRLGAFFFFARNIPERNAATLIRTLAYQLVLFDVGIGAVISRIAENIPRIAEMPLDFQFANLLSEKALGSVEWSRGPIVLVIDAFDECEGETDRKILLVILVSRQEPDIDRTLKSHPAVYSCSLDIDSMTNREDVLEFVRHRLNQIRMENEYLPLDWPGDDSICALTDRAAGLFVWASTACLYTESHSSDRRLNELITQKSVESSSEPFANLDSLYKTGIQSAGRWTDPSFRSDCCHIFGAILCARTPLSCSTIDSLLPLSQPCLRTISRLGCVLRSSEIEGIRTLHPSL